MSIVSKTTVKSYFETGDRPTQAEFADAWDTAIRDPLVAIATAAEGGKTGILEILGSTEVTALTAGALGRQFLSIAGTTSARDALGITSVASLFLDAASTASSQSLLGISTHQATFLLSESTASSQSLLGGGTAGIAVFEAATTASAVASLGVTNHVVQQVHTSDGAVATGTTVLPSDDTIPQITEGDEYMTLAITPKDSNNILVIDVVANYANSSTSGPNLTVALFQDSTADALAAVGQRVVNANTIYTTAFRHRMTAGTTSATTFRVRIGAHIAGTTTFNGASEARIYGGVYASSITITELSG